MECTETHDYWPQFNSFHFLGAIWQNVSEMLFIQGLIQTVSVFTRVDSHCSDLYLHVCDTVGVLCLWKFIELKNVIIIWLTRWESLINFISLNLHIQMATVTLQLRVTMQWTIISSREIGITIWNEAMLASSCRNMDKQSSLVDLTCFCDITLPCRYT